MLKNTNCFAKWHIIGVTCITITLLLSACGGSEKNQASNQQSSDMGAKPSSHSTSQPASPESKIIEKAIQAQGGKQAWLDKRNIAIEVEMEQLDDPKAQGINSMSIFFGTAGRANICANLGGMKMHYLDGKTTVSGSDGKAIDDEKTHAMAKFMLPTFQYIFSLPWKLQDDGVVLSSLPDRVINGKTLKGVYVTYEKGVGETPDDWYKFYFDSESGQLVDVLWIVTSPGHDNMIEWCQFGDFKDVDGILMPHSYNFVKADETGKSEESPWMTLNVKSVKFGTECGKDKSKCAFDKSRAGKKDCKFDKKQYKLKKEKCKLDKEKCEKTNLNCKIHRNK